MVECLTMEYGLQINGSLDTVMRSNIAKIFLNIENNMAIRKMLETLDDSFTRFLEPEKFRSLRFETRGVLTGVGLSIGYLTKIDMQASGLVISASSGGPVYRAGGLSGDGNGAIVVDEPEVTRDHFYGMDGIPPAVRETTVARMLSIIERQATAVVEESSVIISWDGQQQSIPPRR
ncbi:hypothetical protein VNO78_20363 [Psophocarpus tetragonolobus]|uniref:Uncharacterized protein n=1 Tax=Psophocarpus tetragonolobus TaxID=3891 RepID=A0AAN9S981_PSOTE